MWSLHGVRVLLRACVVACVCCCVRVLSRACVIACVSVSIERIIRFELSLQCGNLAAAQECAEQLDKPDCWRRLAAEAMRHGDVEKAEFCCTKTKDFERLVCDM